MEISKRRIYQSDRDVYNKILSDINTSLNYINACKLQISIDKMRCEMGYLGATQYKEEVRKLLKSIMAEVTDIRNCISSEIFVSLAAADEKLNAEKKTEPVSETPPSNANLNPQMVESILAEMFRGIRNILDYNEYKDILTIHPSKPEE